jgi:hypothetical protein
MTDAARRSGDRSRRSRDSFPAIPRCNTVGADRLVEIRPGFDSTPLPVIERPQAVKNRIQPFEPYAVAVRIRCDM